MKGYITTWKHMKKVDYIKAKARLFGKIYSSLPGEKIVWRFQKGMMHNKSYIRISKMGCYFIPTESMTKDIEEYMNIIPCEIFADIEKAETAKDRLIELANARGIVVIGLQ